MLHVTHSLLAMDICHCCSIDLFHLHGMAPYQSGAWHCSMHSQSEASTPPQRAICSQDHECCRYEAETGEEEEQSPQAAQFSCISSALGIAALQCHAIMRRHGTEI